MECVRVKTKKRPDLWLSFYVSDYYRDTNHLRTIEHGAYLLLIFNAWTNDGKLPSDPERLRSITRMNSKEWRASRNELMKFFYLDEGFYRHKRIDAELDKAKGIIAKRQGAGRASAAARSAQQKDNMCSTHVRTSGSTERQLGGRPLPLPITKKESLTKNTLSENNNLGTENTVSAIDRDFSVFYEAYGRKRDPKAAREQFAKALKIVDFETLMAGVRRYTRAQPDPQFRKDPHRWLRDQRWRDEDLVTTAAPPVPSTAKSRVLAELLDGGKKTHQNAFKTTIDSVAEEIAPTCFEL
jgi:uncharacterized protein YdaU (DUF1376 family)